MAAFGVWRRRIGARTAWAACALAILLVGCSDGASNTASPTTLDSVVTSTTRRPVDTSFTGQGSGDFCNLAKSYNDRFANVGSSATSAQMRTVLQEGKTAINQAATAAPAEIKSDAQLIATAFTRLADAFDRANYDPTKVDLTALQTLQSADFQSATQRFDAYLRNVCRVGS